MKTVVNRIYVHKTNVGELMSLPFVNRQMFADIMWCVGRQAELAFPFEVIRVDTKVPKIALIDAEGWIERYEPVVSDSYHYDLSKPGYPQCVNVVNGGKTVYHRKHEFVDPTRCDFDFWASKERTELLESIPEIHNNKSRIGSYKIWRSLMDKYKLPVYMPKDEH